MTAAKRTSVREIPMLFTGGMVRAILGGRKTQTRRLNFKGAPGDRIWVKETFQICGNCVCFFVKSACEDARECPYCDAPIGKWKPASFMPRNLSGITLEVLAVRQEPLQDISDADAFAEGVEARGCFESGPGPCRGMVPSKPVWAYQRIWKAIHGESSWESNPTVFVIGFKIRKESDFGRKAR